MRVALVHDYLLEYGDAERVLEVLHRLYPTAPIYTAFVDRQRLDKDAERFAGWDLRPTFAQRLPWITHQYQTFRAWIPYFWESLDLSEYDLVISSSGDYSSKSILTRPETLHVSYCHTPPRYLWEPAPVRSWYTHWCDTSLRHYDFYTSQRVDRFVTTSQRVARRISKFYGRMAEVIPPPVAIRGEGKVGSEYYLYVGRLSHDQQIDLVIEACKRLDLPLWIVGTGKDMAELQKLANDRIRFLGALPQQQMTEIYSNAKALVSANANADFSFAAVEAMGHGVPVIAPEPSGIREIVLNYRTGLLFNQPTLESLSAAISQFEGLRFSSQACIERAEEFAESVFTSKFEWYIAQAIDEYQFPNRYPLR